MSTLDAPVDLGRCTGHCCRWLVIRGATALWLLEQAEGLRIANDGALAPDGTVTDGFAEARFLADALVPVAPRFEYAPSDAGWIARPAGALLVCRHIRANGDCGAYRERPWMCRSYPNHRRCDRPGCTWGWARRLGPPEYVEHGVAVDDFAALGPLVPDRV